VSARMTSVRRVAELLPALNAAFPTDLLAVVRNFLAATAGAKTADILMADYDLLVLCRLPPDMTAGIVESLSVDDSAAGRAFINQDPITVVDGDEVHVYVPISLRAERLGVLDVTLLVPAYEVGGDLIDYAVQIDELFVTVIDAMGRGLRASLLGTLKVTAFRVARRSGLALADDAIRHIAVASLSVPHSTAADRPVCRAADVGRRRPDSAGICWP
jgi:hypothetical protein